MNIFGKPAKEVIDKWEDIYQRTVEESQSYHEKLHALGFPKSISAPGSGSISSNTGISSGPPPRPSSDRLCTMIAMRMRWPEGRTLPMSYIGAHQTNEKVFVFMVHNEQAVTLEDDVLMFPSDTLITKMRLILG